MSAEKKCDKKHIREKIIQTIAELKGQPCVVGIDVLCENVTLEEHEWKELEDEFDIVFTQIGTQLLIKYMGVV